MVLVLPAYAGMIPPSKRFAIAKQGAPRIRGDEHQAMVDMPDNAKCSLHAWGCPIRIGIKYEIKLSYAYAAKYFCLELC